MPRALSFRGHYLGLFISGGEACNSQSCRAWKAQCGTSCCPVAQHSCVLLLRAGRARKQARSLSLPLSLWIPSSAPVNEPQEAAGQVELGISGYHPGPGHRILQ